MASGLAASLLSALLFCSIVFGSADQRNITAEPGQNVTLPCRAAGNKPVIVVEWSKPDLGENDHVALYLDDQFDYHGQHPAYRNRVDLQDREMKDGDVSLVLKDVTTNDTGTYECRVAQRENRRRKRSHLKTEPISTVTLDVSAPGSKDGQKGGGGNEDRRPEDGGSKAGLAAGVSVAVLVLLGAAGGFLLYKKLRRSSQDQNQPPAAEAEPQPMNDQNRPEAEP
ncbi:coxsackievirus and adenovirus receptor-like [Anableps anableps]